jgi:hypothetical protein
MSTTSPAKNSDEIQTTISVSSEDSELYSFLSSHGIRPVRNWGIFNGPPPSGDIQEMLKHPAPYLLITASASVLIAALRAYAKTHNRRIIIRKTKAGITVDATNFSPEELKDVGVLDLIKLEAIKEQNKISKQKI